MKKGLFIMIGLMITSVIIFLPPDLWSAKNNNQQHQIKSSHTPDQSNNLAQPKQKTYTLTAVEQQDLSYVTLDELQAKLPITANIDQTNGQVKLTMNKFEVSFLKDVAVMEKNGLYYPMKKPILYNQDQILIPMETVANMCNGTATVNKGMVQLTVKPTKQPPAIQTISHKMTTDEFITHLSFLQKPIKGAHVSTQNSSLPGAPRTYRKGVHEGIDWYGGDSTGVPITKNTPVLSMADGVVVRVDHDYQEMTTPQRKKLLALGRKNNGQTPQYVLDKLRGRSVWIQHKQGIMARYVHLDRIPTQLKVGQKVTPGDLIGYVGNSGTSDGAKGNNKGVHLHLDLFIYGKWFWDQYSMNQRRLILETVFPKDG